MNTTISDEIREDTGEMRENTDKITRNKANLIPFTFKITLPSPRYGRIITNRDERGKILKIEVAK
ncbi:MAG: hypothetical protein PHH17_00800 [Candidatus Pacebacteria bacterium]|nr:hypothetical protein [Candidatus Paceibacterota bacterium]MDD3072552.1 hypothetical protein [Candidatus Paceibacterota bacterium]MDD3729258.1 hypothetical protein [Candidatus Paceibacterota bacterium]MDD4201487.1 hypothetical protein [Candidatus Paceibacterota bacterium]MDD4466946.1 hypothetical protein [Candidatus Paceibacterota bacterium]